MRPVFPLHVIPQVEMFWFQVILLLTIEQLSGLMVTPYTQVQLTPYTLTIWWDKFRRCPKITMPFACCFPTETAETSDSFQWTYAIGLHSPAAEINTLALNESSG
jgi:hypothetical protein